MHPKKFISFSLIYLYILLAFDFCFVFSSNCSRPSWPLCMLCTLAHKMWTVQTMIYAFRFIRMCFAVWSCTVCCIERYACVSHVRRMFEHTRCTESDTRMEDAEWRKRNPSTLENHICWSWCPFFSSFILSYLWWVIAAWTLIFRWTAHLYALDFRRFFFLASFWGFIALLFWATCSAYVYIKNKGMMKTKIWAVLYITEL